MDEELGDSLNKALGPEYLSFKNGYAYIEGHKAIALANQLFGFDGWSTEVRNCSIDFVDHKDHKFSIGVKCIVRVTLKSGTFREDLGYGSCINMPHRAQAYEKAHKEAVTDGLKRTLRQFGEATGNCVYNKRYIQEVRTVKTETPDFDPHDLIRENHPKRRRTDDIKPSPSDTDSTNAFLQHSRLAPISLQNEPAQQPHSPQNQPSKHTPFVHPNQPSAQQRAQQELQRQQQEQKERKQRFQEEKERLRLARRQNLPQPQVNPAPQDSPQKPVLPPPAAPQNVPSQPKAQSRLPDLASSDDEDSGFPMFVSGNDLAQGTQSEYNPAKSKLKTSLPDTSTKVKK